MIKKIFLFFLFCFLTFVLTKSLFHSGVPETHDGNNHLVRFANYFISVKELQIPPRLAPNLVNRYGYPVFNYNNPLANILSLPFSILGFHYELTFKLITIVFIFLGIVGAYYFLKNFNFSKKAKLFSLILFTLSPYTLISIVYRGNIGEVMAWGILPWIFHFLIKLKNEKKLKIFNKLYLKLYLFFILLFLAHNIIAFFASVLIFVFLVFIFKKDFLKWRKFLLIFFFSFMTCLWFWLPAIMEKDLVIMDNVDLTKNYYKHFPSLSQLLKPTINFGYSYWGNIDSLSFSLGLVQVFILFFLVIILLSNVVKKTKTINKDMFVFILLSFVLIIFQLGISRFFYQIIPFADFIQFPWRLTLLFIIILIPISAFIFDNLKKFWRMSLFFLLFIQLIQFFNTKPIDYFSKNKIDYDLSTETTSVNHENLPKTFIFQGFDNWQPSPEIINGTGNIQVDKWRGSVRSYHLNLTSKSLIIEPTAYFPGWETKIKNLDNLGGNWQTVIYTDDDLIAGRLAYRLDYGNYLVKSRFTQKTWPRIVGNSLSIFSFLFLIFFYFLTQQKEKNKERR